jgi:hypothetical protein
MIEATRSLGVAARFVSGYIFVANRSGFAGGVATHAWMQAYLPGAGWIDCHPTNSIIGNRNLIRVAVAWAPDQVLPWGHLRELPQSLSRHGRYRNRYGSGRITVIYRYCTDTFPSMSKYSIFSKSLDFAVPDPS